MSTKVYRNDSSEPISILGVGEIPAGDQVSITSEYQPPVVIENYPGLVDVLAEEAAAAEAAPADEAETSQEPINEQAQE